MLQSTIDQYLKSALYFDDPTDIAKDKCGHTWVVTGNPQIVKDENSYKKLLKLSPGDSLSLTENSFLLFPKDEPVYSIDFWMHLNLSETIIAEGEEDKSPYVKIDMQNNTNELYNWDFYFYKNKYRIPRLPSSNDKIKQNIKNYSSNTASQNILSLSDKLIHITIISEDGSTYYRKFTMYLNDNIIESYTGTSSVSGNITSWYYPNLSTKIDSYPKISIINPVESGEDFYIGYFRVWSYYMEPSIILESNYYYNFDFDNMVIM